MIEVKNITKNYGNQIAVNNISFKIGQGEIVGFLGPNGAGKSTVMKIINSYMSPDSGLVRVGGLDVLENSVEAKRKIGYLPENNPLYVDMFVKEYLEYVADIYKINFSEIEGIIKQTGLVKEQNKKISELSKGYKQRVGLAAAILHNPDYLILDEPTTGLDPNQILEIRDLIKEFGKEKTVLLSTHILQEVEAMCDRVIIINKGKVVVDENLDNFKEDDADNCMVVFDKEIDVQVLQSNLKVEVLSSDSNTKFIFKHYEKGILNKILEFSDKQNLSVIEFKVSKKSLEDTFREFTS